MNERVQIKVLSGQKEVMSGFFDAEEQDAVILAKMKVKAKRLGMTLPKGSKIVRVEK